MALNELKSLFKLHYLFICEVILLMSSYPLSLPFLFYFFNACLEYMNQCCWLNLLAFFKVIVYRMYGDIFKFGAFFPNIIGKSYEK